MPGRRVWRETQHGQKASMFRGRDLDQPFPSIGGLELAPSQPVLANPRYDRSLAL